jgi:hypothetical protein
MTVKHYVILLDIDNTLINFDAYSGKSRIVWTGSLAIWREYINLLIECFDTPITKLHLGIATAKQEYHIIHPTLKLKGDVISAAVIEDEDFINYCGASVIGLGANLGIKKFLNKDLIIFTNNQCKSKFALDVALQNIQEKIKDTDATIDKNSIMLIDDQELNCISVKANGYKAICVGNLAELSPREAVGKISSYFLKIFEIFDLFIPMKMLKAVGAISDENDRERVEDTSDEMINYMSTREEKVVTTLATELSSKKRRREAALLNQMGVFKRQVRPRVEVHSNDNLHSKGIKP